MDDNLSATGKKVFFLYPQTLIQNEVSTDLIMQEFEVYTIRDHVALRRILKRYPDSIVFVNPDEKISEKEWDAWIQSVMTDPDTAEVGIGILSSTTSDEIKHKYLTQIKVTCGFIHVSTDLKKLILQITEVLKKHNALGRRKYIRATSENEKMTTVNMPIDGHYVSGFIHDISATGFSCSFPEDPGLEKNSLVSNMQIKLQGTLMRAEGIVFGSRMDELMKIYVIVLTPKTDSAVRSKILKYIQSNIQARMDMELKK
jgi:hypothetical protein